VLTQKKVKIPKVASISSLAAGCMTRLIETFEIAIAYDIVKRYPKSPRLIHERHERGEVESGIFRKKP
jgi:hypothetical protein